MAGNCNIEVNWQLIIYPFVCIMPNLELSAVMNEHVHGPKTIGGEEIIWAKVH